MGERLRQALNIAAGDKVTIITHRLNESGTIAPRYSDYELLGSFLTKRYEFDGALVFMPLQMLQEDLEVDRRTVSSIDLDLTDPNAAPRIAAEIRKSLGRDDLKVSDWQALNARFVGALEVEKVMMFIILTLIVLVAAMNVVASFTMLVRVKRGSIAILRTMGAGTGHDRARLLPVGRRCRASSAPPSAPALGLLISTNIAVDRRPGRPAEGRLDGARVHCFSAGDHPAGRGADRDRHRHRACRSRRRPIPPGAARGSNPSKDCGMSNDAFPLSLRALQRTFVQGDRRLEVLRAISLDLKAGEIVALVGQSGSGKSTLLHIAGLLERPDGGEVVVDGKPTRTLGDGPRTALRRKFLGFVYQYHHLLPEFSALENVMLPQMLNGLSRSEARVRSADLLAMVGLKDRAEHRPGRLSGGEQQRVAIARAVANAPRVLLADEPTGNLDAGTADTVFRQLLALVRETGMAALIATHNPELAARMDRTLHLKDGILSS